MQAVHKTAAETINQLRNLAVRFRAMQLASHNFHNQIQGNTFAADHEWLGELYGTYEGIYDGIIERMIGLGVYAGSLKSYQIEAADKASVISSVEASTPETMFSALLSAERAACAEIQVLMKDTDLSEGTKNMLAGIADAAEVRIYKFQQRIGGNPQSVPMAKSRGVMSKFGSHFGTMAAFKGNISKAGQGWYHGNQHDEKSATSVKASSYVAKMAEAKQCMKSGDAMGAKLAESDAAMQWRKMGVKERAHAMKLVSDNASEDIGKTRDTGFEFGHGKRVR